MSKDAGNVLFLILIAVALFAALSYAVTGSTRTVGPSISNEKARAYAAQILQFGATVKGAVTRVKISSACTDEMIDFSTPNYLTYGGAEKIPVNPNAPSDKRCNIFAPSGGGVSVVIPSAEALAPPNAPTSNMLQAGHGTIWVLQGPLIGTSGPSGTVSANDLMLVIPWLKKEVCMAINDLVGIASVGEDVPGWTSTGTTGTSQGDFISDRVIAVTPEFAGKTSYCRKQATGEYHFTQFLMER